MGKFTHMWKLTSPGHKKYVKTNENGNTTTETYGT